MNTIQKKRLLALARKIRNQPKDREQIIATFAAAKILTKKGNFTSHYANLGKAIAAAK